MSRLFVSGDVRTATTLRSRLRTSGQLQRTDSLPSLLYARDYYTRGEDELIGASIHPATEHSVMCMASASGKLKPFAG